MLQTKHRSGSVQEDAGPSAITYRLQRKEPSPCCTLTTSQKAGITIRSAQANAKGKDISATAYVPDVEKATWRDGRGKTSYSSEPDYAGILGYVSVWTRDGLDKNASFSETPWTVPVYQPDKQFWAETGTIPHKTQVVVIGQKLEKKSYKQYEGYLQVIRMDTKEACWLKVEHFITDPYWEKSLTRAIEEGYCIATFNQICNYYPVTKGNEKADLPDCTLVLLQPKNSIHGSSPDKTINSVGGIVFKELAKGYGSVTVWFNEKDLTLSY